MTKRPTDDLIPTAKRGKREAESQGGRDQPDDDEEEAADPGGWQRASEEVIKARKFVKARRGAPPVAPSATGTASNPFAGISLAAPGTASAAAPVAAQASAAPANGARQLAEASPSKGQSLPAPSTASAPAATEPAESSPAANNAPASADAVAAPATDPTPPADASTLSPNAESAKPPAAETPSAGGDATVAPGTAAASKPSTGEAAAGVSPSANAPATADAKAQPASSFTFGSGFKASNGTGFAALAGSNSVGGFSKNFGGFGGAASSPSKAGFTFASAGSAGGLSFGSLPPAGGGFPPVHSIFGGSAAAAPVFGGGEKAKSEAAEGVASPHAEAGTTPAVPLKPEEPMPTGEEDEATEFQHDGVLYGFDPAGWKERGRGELRVNIAPSGQARLVMRQRGNLRLLLNANLWPEMAINEMDGGKGATFAVVNATDDSAAEADGSGKAADSAAAAAAAGSTSGGDRPSGLTTFAVRFKTAQILSQFVQKTNALKKQAPSAAKGTPADLV